MTEMVVGLSCRRSRFTIHIHIPPRIAGAANSWSPQAHWLGVRSVVLSTDWLTRKPPAS